MVSSDICDCLTKGGEKNDIFGPWIRASQVQVDSVTKPQAQNKPASLAINDGQSTNEWLQPKKLVKQTLMTGQSKAANLFQYISKFGPLGIISFEDFLERQNMKIIESLVFMQVLMI